jgi:hypothetical protein
MSLRLTRPAIVVVFAAAFSLVCLPACGKKPTPTDRESPPPPGGAPPGPSGGTAGTRDPMAPRSPVFSSTTEAPMRAATEGNLKQIGFALHAYHDANGALPGGFADKTGKPGLSWRVAILPYIEQNNLYQQFKFDEPWDSEANKKLIPMMPKVYAPPRTDTNGYTFYRGFTGTGTWLPQQQAVRPGQAIHGVRITDFTDGTSNTIMVAEAYDPVIWTKPDELVFAPNSLPKLGGVFSSGFTALMADGSVKFFRGTISPKTLANLIQINDGNIVNVDD